MQMGNDALQLYMAFNQETKQNIHVVYIFMERKIYIELILSNFNLSLTFYLDH